MKTFRAESTCPCCDEPLSIHVSVPDENDAPEKVVLQGEVP